MHHEKTCDKLIGVDMHLVVYMMSNLRPSMELLLQHQGRIIFSEDSNEKLTILDARKSYFLKQNSYVKNQLKHCSREMHRNVLFLKLSTKQEA